MRSFLEIMEARGDTAVFTFGRFNPPTTGHEKLIMALAKQQSKNAGSIMYVYPSHSQSPKKDPIPHAKKIAYMRKMFPKYARNITVSKARTTIEVAVELYNKGHKAIVMVVGSDRVAEFDRLLNEYNGVTGKRHGYYGFDNIEVVSAGERDPDSEGVEGMSASKMRAAASSGDFDSFKTGLPSGFKDGLKLYNDVRKNMGIREERDMGEMSDFETLRDMYLTGKIWNVGDIVEAHGNEGKVIRKGTNYLTFVSEDGKVHKTWLHDIVERDYRKEYDNYQGQPEQIARRSSRNKARRIMGNKIVDGMDVGHKDNDPMNNDPSNLKNEDPSDNRREPRLREVKQDKDVKDKEGTQPAKYYAGDMAKSTKNKRDAHFKAKKSGPAPGDATAKTKPSVHTKKFKQMYGESSLDEVRVKQAVAGGKVQKLVTAHGLKFKGKVYKEIDMELVKINNSTEMVTFNIIHPKEIFGNETNISFKALRRGPFMATDTSKINELSLSLKDLQKSGLNVSRNEIDKLKKELETLRVNVTKKVSMEVLDKDADAGDYIDDFAKSDAPQFKGKSKEKRKDMAVAAYLSKKDEAVSPAQQAAIAISKKERGEKPKKEAVISEKIEGLVNKAEKSGMPYSILKKVYDRGMAAYKTGHRPGTTAQQWAFARVNSFVTKSSGTWGKADKDLAKQVRGESVETESLWDNIRKKKARIAKGSGEKMRSKGDKGAPTPNQIKRASEDLNEWGEVTEKDDKSGKELNNPTRGDVKKYKVYVRNKKGNVVKVEFGDPNMSIKRDDPARRKAFRARHNCDQKKDKTTAGYWSCKFWSTKSVTDLMKG